MKVETIVLGLVNRFAFALQFYGRLYLKTASSRLQLLVSTLALKCKLFCQSNRFAAAVWTNGYALLLTTGLAITAYGLLHPRYPFLRLANGDYGPMPPYFESSEDPNYHFNHVGKTLLPLPVGRIDELSKFQFQTLLLDSVPASLRTRLKKHLAWSLDQAERYQLDPFWPIAVMWAESHFDHTAVSYMDARGLMQIMPDTGHFLSRRLGRPLSPELIERLISEPKINIEMGIFYLKLLLEKFHGNYQLATIAYNMGPGFVAERLRAGQTLGTNNLYLEKVLTAYRQLSKSFLVTMEQTTPPYRYTLVVQNTLVVDLAQHHQDVAALENWLSSDWIETPLRSDTFFHVASSEVFP